LLVSLGHSSSHSPYLYCSDLFIIMNFFCWTNGHFFILLLCLDSPRTWPKFVPLTDCKFLTQTPKCHWPSLPFTMSFSGALVRFFTAPLLEPFALSHALQSRRWRILTISLHLPKYALNRSKR
jgi:hypothetical protein